MSKQPSQRDDRKIWDDEGGAARSGHPSHELPLAPKREAETALYYFNIRTESGVIEDPEGVTHPGVQAARDEALATARTMTAEGDRKGEDRRSGASRSWTEPISTYSRSRSQKRSTAQRPVEPNEVQLPQRNSGIGK